VAIGSGIYGLHSLEFIEWFLKMGGGFDNPQHGNISQETWRTGYRSAMAVFISFGIAALCAAYGLSRRRPWAQYLWLVLVALLVAAPFEGLPNDPEAWIWLVVSLIVLVFSVLEIRAQRHRHAAPPTAQGTPARAAGHERH
jgi:hypothetical protein